MVRSRLHRLAGALLFIAALAGAIYGLYGAVHAMGSDDWTGDRAPSVTKLVDLTEGVLPPAYNKDCDWFWYTPPSPERATEICGADTSLGLMGGNNTIYPSGDKSVGVEGPVHSDSFIATPEASLLLLARSAGHPLGSELGFYDSLGLGGTELESGTLRPFYRVKRDPDHWLVNPATGRNLVVNTNVMTFSANMQWMVIDSPLYGLLRVDMNSMAVMPFAPSLEPYDFYGPSEAQITITNDGRYVAVSWLSGAGGVRPANLSVYDLSTCNGALEDGKSVGANCQNKDIWTGEHPNGTFSDAGIAGQIAGAHVAVNLRFIDNDNLAFNTTYNAGSATRFDAATFVASVNGAPIHKIGLLGMGDSYISGEGEFAYRLGTDTEINRCHLSELSYPFLLGGNFNTYNSVACSGAKTNDVNSPQQGQYTGQVKDGVQQRYRSDVSSILSTFTPGYINQNQFVSTYTPQAVLLSVGGNDFGFADILKSCVASGGTCFNSYEDRKELLDRIGGRYDVLRQTYASIKQASPGVRLYVVGYPQVAKIGGDCALDVHLNASEIEFANQLIAYIDSVVAAAAKSEGVVYVDSQHAFDGHRLCEAPDGAEIAMNGLTAGGDGGITAFGKTVNVIGSESYHPTQLGHRLLADTVAAQTDKLMKPMPLPDATAEAPPDDESPMLQNVPYTNRPVNKVTYDDSMTDSTVPLTTAEHLALSQTADHLQPNGQYQLVLHSDPISLGAVAADANGDISTTFMLPASVPPGMHTLHVYGRNLVGEDIDIQQIIYVVSADTAAAKCPIVAASGQDADNDGIDDACDPVITNSIGTPETPTPVPGMSQKSGSTLTTQVVASGSGANLSSRSTSAPTGQQVTAKQRVLGVAATSQPAILKEAPVARSAHTDQAPGLGEYLLAFMASFVAASVITYTYHRCVS